MGVDIRPTVIWGGTGHARVLRELLQRYDRRVAAVVDNRNIPPPFEGVPMLLGLNGLQTWLSDQGTPTGDFDYAVAVGGSFGRDRIELANQMESLGLQAKTLIHPEAMIANDAVIEAGAQVLTGAIVGVCTFISRCVIVNTKVSVDHDTHIGPGVHIGPGATLCGEIRVGARTFIGAGAIVLPRITIGSDAIIGAGSVVTENIPNGATVRGAPAKPVIQ